MQTARINISPILSGIEKRADAYLLIPLDGFELQAVIGNLIRLKHKFQENSVYVPLPEIIDMTIPRSDDWYMEKIRSLIDAKIDDDQFGIVELCDALCMSRAQVYRRFKSLSGRTPHDYLRSYRLQKAKELLLTTTFNVSEVAYRTGFKNVSHFSRVFTIEFGKGPSKFSK